jgi:hypothetical protein
MWMLMFLKKHFFKILTWFFVVLVIFLLFAVDSYLYQQKYKNIWFEKWKKIIQNANIKNWKIFINIRNFDFKNNKEEYFLEEYDLNKIKNVKYWYITLSYKKINFVHNYFILEFTDNKSFVFSIETRKHKWEEISLKSILFNRYDIIKIFSTKNDLYSYIKSNNYSFNECNIKFFLEEKKEFLKKIININLNWKKYNLIYRNCFNLSLNLIKNSFDKYIFKQIYYYFDLKNKLCKIN